MKAITLLACITFFCTKVFAQYPLYGSSHETWYAKDAAERLPEWYKKEQFDSIRAYVNTTANTTGFLYVFATRLLVDIQQGRFDENVFKNVYFLDTLQHYAFWVRRSQATTPPVSNEVGARLEDMPYEDRLFLFDAVWARLLPQTRQLDSTEVFVCRVIEGRIENPTSVIRERRKQIPIFDSLYLQRARFRRNGLNGNFACTAGIWSPTGNASLLGTHPSFGLILGGRGKWNEINLDMSFRFGRAAHDYTVLRGDSVYTRHFYEGTYIGIEYTRYLYRTLTFELGITGGVGYDVFDIAADKDDNSNDYLKPYDVGSLNLNVGWRMNYFYSPRSYFGLEGKFNHIQYNNSGGSAVDGNAYTLTLYIGHN